MDWQDMVRLKASGTSNRKFQPGLPFGLRLSICTIREKKNQGVQHKVSRETAIAARLHQQGTPDPANNLPLASFNKNRFVLLTHQV